MISILFSLSVYIVTACLHVLLYRLLEKRGIHTFSSVLIFFGGLAVVFFGAKSLPATAIALYSLLSWLHVILFTSPYFNDLGPSITLYFALRKKKVMTKDQFLALLSDKKLLIDRLDTMIAGGYVAKQENRFFITPKGRLLHEFLETYRKLIGWKSHG